MKRAEIWRNTKIPAWLFFEIMETGNLKSLIKDIPENKGRKKPKNKVLSNTWDFIFDKYFDARDDMKMRLILKTKKRLLMQSRLIALITEALRVLALLPLPQEHEKRIMEALKKAKITVNDRSEIPKVLKTQLGQLKTRHALDADYLKGLMEGERKTFHQNCVILEGYGYTISENVSLERYIAYETEISNKNDKENARRQANRSSIKTGN